MTPRKAEATPPFQGGGCSRYDRPLTTPETISAERPPMDRADLLDPNLTASVEQLWGTERDFLDKLQAQVQQKRQVS